MKRENRNFHFFKNVLLLTATALLMRSVSLSFNLYLKNKLGADGVGLFSLIMNLFSFAVTFATSGVSLLATRLVSEALGKNRPLEAKSAMKRCLFYALSFGGLAFFLLFTFAQPLGEGLLGDARTVLSLRALAVSLPFLSLSSALAGYFTAVRRVAKSAATQVGEQFLRIFLTVSVFTYLAPADLEMMCFFVVLGGVVSDMFSLSVSFVLYRLDLKKHNRAKGSHIPSDLNRRILAIGLPVAFSSYFRSALVTLEHLLIPRGLVAFGMTHTDALAAYGVLEAMALPIVLFPYAFLSPFCNLLVPEIAEQRAGEKNDEMRKTAERALSFVSVFGVGVATVMLTLAFPIGEVFCSSREAAGYIMLLAPLVPIMYADTTVDALLKGMDEQLYTMRVNLFDSLLGVVLALLTVPLLGIRGYVLNLILCEVINFSLSVSRLSKKLGPRYLLFDSLFLPLLAGAISAFPVRHLASVFMLSGGKGALFFLMAIAAGLYLLVLWGLRRMQNVKCRMQNAKRKKSSA
ncbi:MAG: oligosaccharide flippase family protein [Clostridia bacterium]|nr:oligosaccharide flippase family protein [Clostridia bacterium]